MGDYAKAKGIAGHKDKPLTNDPMEATYIGINMWKQAVEKAKSTDVDKVIAAMAGQTFKAPSGIVSKMDEKNHHLHKSVFIGEIKADGQFNVVWKTPGPVKAKPWSPYIEGNDKKKDEPDGKSKHSEHPPEALARLHPLSRIAFSWEGGRRQRGGAALQRGGPGPCTARFLRPTAFYTAPPCLLFFCLFACLLLCAAVQAHALTPSRRWAMARARPTTASPRCSKPLPRPTRPPLPSFRPWRRRGEDRRRQGHRHEGRQGHDPVTGAEVTVPDDAEDIVNNNRMRGEFDTALASLQAVSRTTSPARRTAIDALRGETPTRPACP